MLYLGMDETGHDIPSVKKGMQVHVDYYGFAIPVEPWARFVAVDADGKVHCYDAKPDCFQTGKQWLMGCYSSRVRYCGEFDLEGADWRDTLKEITTYVTEK